MKSELDLQVAESLKALKEAELSRVYSNGVIEGKKLATEKIISRLESRISYLEEDLRNWKSIGAGSFVQTKRQRIRFYKEVLHMLKGDM